MSGALTNDCWVVTQGIAGMESQARGLAEHLPFTVRQFRIGLSQPWRTIAPYSAGNALSHIEHTTENFMPPWPRVLIGCGRQSIPVSRAVKAASGGRTFTVQCQDPRVPTSWFDLVVPPEHDRLKGPNVFPIIGSPNLVTPDRLAAARREFASAFEPIRAPRVAVLIGGDSRAHGSVTTEIASELGRSLRSLSATFGIMLSFSRRTAPSAVEKLQRSLAGTDARIWDGSGPNPYWGMLAWADAFVVTGDSVNMVCEAASTGRPVHVVELAGAHAKSHRFHRSLRERRITRPFRGIIEQWTYSPLNESARAADEIKRQLDLLPSGPDIKRGVGALP